MAGLIGTKSRGMTSIFGEGGAIIPCTVIQSRSMCGNTKKNRRIKDGLTLYNWDTVIKRKNTTKPMKNISKNLEQLQKAKVNKFRGMDNLNRAML